MSQLSVCAERNLGAVGVHQWGKKSDEVSDWVHIEVHTEMPSTLILPD